LSIFLVVASCSSQTSFQRRADKDYQIHRSEFDQKLVEHFPDHIEGSASTIVSGANLRKNEVGLLLYEYDVSKSLLKKIKKQATRLGVARYSVEDSCLFIVNRFETMKTRENYETVTAIDSIEANKLCYQNYYPVPNFIAVDKPEKNTALKLNKTYTIYVFGAESGNHFKEYKLGPNPQMPESWKNGYSKGVAISEAEGTVIYWGIIW